MRPMDLWKRTSKAERTIDSKASKQKAQFFHLSSRTKVYKDEIGKIEF